MTGYKKGRSWPDSSRLRDGVSDPLLVSGLNPTNYVAPKTWLTQASLGFRHLAS